MEQGREKESRHGRDEVDERGRQVEPGHEDKQSYRSDHRDDELRKVLAEVALELINAFEADGRLVVDALELDRPVYDQYQVIPDLFTEVGGGQPVRYIVDVEGGEVIEKRQIDYRLAPDFAAVDSGRAMLPCDVFWMLGISAAGHSGRKFFDQLVRADWSNPGLLDVYQAPENHYLGGEPVFICDPNDDRSGAIICQLFDAELVTSAFAIFDAFDVGRGPQALLYLRNPVRLGFHAVFSAVS